MEYRSSNIKKNLKETCDSIIKNFDSPPKKRPRTKSPSVSSLNDSSGKKFENSSSINLYRVISYTQEKAGESLILNLSHLNDESIELKCNLLDSW